MRSTHDPFNFQNCQRIRILPLDNPKDISRVHGLWGKTCNRINCKGQLILYKRGSWLSEFIIHSQRNQTFHQNKIQWNKNNSRTVSKRTVQHSLHHMELGTSRSTNRPTWSPLLNARHWTVSLAWARKHKILTIEEWKQVASSDDSLSQVFQVDRRRRVCH